MYAGFFNMCKLINMTHHIKRLRNKTYMVTIIDEENIFLLYLNFRNCLERTLIDENSYLNDPRNQNYRTLLILCRNLLILCWNRKWQPTPVLLPGKPHGGGEHGRLQSTRSQRVGHDWAASLSHVLCSFSLVIRKLVQCHDLFPMSHTDQVFHMQRPGWENSNVPVGWVEPNAALLNLQVSPTCKFSSNL